MTERVRVAVREKSLEAPFIGFTPEQTQRVRSHIENTGLPLNNIERVIYRPGRRGEENILGSFQPYDGTLTIYKSIDKLPPIAQHGTIVHELAHGSSPLDERNERLYGSSEAINTAREHAIAVSRQSLETDRYLNGYQAYLAKQLKSGQIDQSRFVEETHAILVELRFNNPERLSDVGTQQKKQATKMGKDAVDLITSNKDAASGYVSGVDRTLVSLIEGLNSKKDIDRHVNNLKGSIVKGGRPILPKKQFPLAA